MNNFDKEFNANWDLYLKTKNANDLHTLIDLIVKNFEDHLNLAPHEAIKTLPNITTISESDESSEKSSSSSLILTTEEFLLAFNWPDLDHLFYFLNEELANLNRQLIKQCSQGVGQQDGIELGGDLFLKFLNLLKTVFILSKNMICLNLITNTSLINQFLSSYSYLLNAMHSNESIKDYFKFLCFLLIKAHDPYLFWFRKYYIFDKRYSNIKPLQINNQRQFSFKFDPAFFSFLFDSLKVIKDEALCKLGIHTYACILNEISSTTNGLTSSLTSSTGLNLNDNLLKAVNPQIVDYLFDILVKNDDSTTNNDYLILNDNFMARLSNSQQNLISSADEQIRLCFNDQQLIACRCLPLVVQILHLSLPDKRLVDLAFVLDKLIYSLEKIERDYIKFELIKSYLIMLTECSDRAALKIAIVSRKFFICVLEQIRLTCLTNKFDNGLFLHEFVRVVLSLIKNLLENSQPVKDIFTECNCYQLLYEILKETDVMDIEISILINEMISEKSSILINKNATKIEKNMSYLDDLENCEMAVILIKLLPFMKQSAQEFSVNNICRLCTLNLKNQLKSCKNSMLLNFILLLNLHKKFSFKLIENLFRAIQILGKCAIRQNELFELIKLLQPKNQFPYGIHVLRCLTLWAKNSTSIGLNLGLLDVQNENEKPSNNSSLSPIDYNLTDSAKLRRTSLLTINQNVLMNMMQTIGTGALSQNAQQQAKYFFDFQQSNSGIRVPGVKKWPGYAFTFHCWIKLRSDLEIFEKKRRQLYSFYSEQGQGFEAFFTSDCSSLVVSVCTKKEFLSVQLRELDFDSSESNRIGQNDNSSANVPQSSQSGANLNNVTSTSDYWHSVAIVHVPSKKPFGYTQVCIYVDGVLKKEADLKLPNFNDSFTQIRVGATCFRPHLQTTSASSSLTAPLANLKNVFNLGYKTGATEKSLSVTSIPSGSQDTVWDPSTCLMGQMSSCFVMHDVITDLQARLLYELGPNQYALNWLDIVEMSDLKSKFLFHYDAKCTKDLTCFDLSHNRLTGKFTGLILSCDNFKESLNAIGSVQLFYPLLNYLSSSQEYLDLVLNDWSQTSKNEDGSQKNKSSTARKSMFDDSELENNVVAMILSLTRYLFHNSDIMQDRFERNNGIALLGFLIQRLPKQFIDVQLLRICQDLVNEAALLNNKSLLNSIYEYLIFDFRIWNKADYEIRIGHIQYISTIVKDDKKYFRKKYGVQFFLDTIKTYFGNPSNNKSAITNYDVNLLTVNNQQQFLLDPNFGNYQIEEDDLRNLRSSFFGLIKYYAQKDIKIGELNALLSFLATTKTVQFQNDLLDMLINLLEAPNASDQLYLLLFEPNLADGLWSMLVQPDLNEQVEKRLVKFIRILLKTKKVYEKNKSRLKLDECGSYAGLTSKIFSEYAAQFYNGSPKLNETLVIDLIETFLVEESQVTNYDNLWHIISLLNLNPVQLIFDQDTLLRTRLKACELIIKFLFVQTSSIRLLAKSAAWQDIVCQLFCVKKLPTKLNSNNEVPPVVVNTIDATPVRQNARASLDYDNDVWENLDSKEMNDSEISNEQVKNIENVADENKIELMVSTPSRNSKNHGVDQIDFNEKLTNNFESSQVTSTAMKKNNLENKSNDSSDPQQIMKQNFKTKLSNQQQQQQIGVDLSQRNDGYDEPKTQNDLSFSISSQDSPINVSNRANLSEKFNLEDFNDEYNSGKDKTESKNGLETEIGNSQEAIELFEKILYIIYRLLWDGVYGSNDDAWKERCQIFSSLHRLSKEFYFIKPIEQIEMRLLEMSIKHCSAEAKKTNSFKEQSLVLENCRELVKLVDYFVSNNSVVSEKLISLTITLLDQIRVFDQKSSPTSTPQSPTGLNHSASAANTQSPVLLSHQINILNESPTKKTPSKRSFSLSSSSSSNNNVPASLLNSYGIIHDEWAETSYLGMNILMNALSSHNLEIFAQTSAKINTILHNRSINNCEEACYFISSVEKVMFESLKDEDEQHYAFLIPIMKCLIEKSHSILQMNVQVPNLPVSSISPTFFEDFKEYCKCDEWRIFIQKQVIPLREQYLAMTTNPCQMNMKIWWNMCYETLMVSIHKRNRILGESKIKFEDSIYNSWKEREKQENLRYQNYLIQLKRNNLAMRKQLHTSLKFLTGERGAWNEGFKEVYWMLSNHENRERMRCKLVENLKFDSHFEASRLRDYSGYSNYSNTSVSSSTLTLSTQEATQKAANNDDPTKNLAQKLSINKEAINTQINEDMVGEEEFASPVQVPQPQSQQQQSPEKETRPQNSPSQVDSGVSSQATTMSRSSSISTLTNVSVKPTVPVEPYDAGAFSQLEEKEKLLIQSECELITVTRVIKGRFELTNKHMYFFDTFSPFYYEHSLNDSNNDTTANAGSGNQPSASFTANIFSTGFNCQDFDILNDLKISLTQLKEVQLRRYNLRRSALEFFLINETSFFINFNKATRNRLYGKIMTMKLPNLLSYPTVRTQVDLLKATDYTEKWRNHELSNFEYLMKLNTIAGRTYNDLSQYPIFPWILKDYISEQLDLNDPSIYRDLSKPIGVLNKKNEDYVRQKYDSFEDPTGTMRPFHYGTHYSNSANVMHYLVRLEPFTTLHIQLQSDRFDVADRQFHSIASTWRILYENPNDVKELIPEFFYLPEFLINMNNFDFGELQSSKNKVNDVTLPKWAKNPEHFIHIHRRALESDYVSDHLNDWIDLIFGYKQQGIESEKALNVFMYYSYEGALDLDAITDPVARRATEGMISNFGQTPTQLLKEPHPKRKSREQSIKDKIILGKPVIIWHQIQNLKAYYVEFCDPKRDNEPIDPIIYLSIPRNHIKSFMQQGLSDPLISVSQSGIIGVNGWQSNDRSLTNLFSFEKDPSLLNEKTKKSIAGPFDPNYEIDHKVFVLTHDSKLLVSGGHWDNSLRVFSLSKYRTISQIYQHSNLVTCVAIDYTGSLIVTGSMDTTCMIWQVVQEFGLSVNLDPVPMHILYGHTESVTSVDISNELDIVASASLDGTVNMHTIRTGSFIRRLSFLDEKISIFKNLTLKLSNERHLLVYVSSLPFENPTQMTCSEQTKKISHDLFLFSINGNLISKEKLSHPVQDMIIKNDNCILALLVNSSPKPNPNSSLNTSKTDNEAGSNQKSVGTASKIVFKEIFDLKTLQSMRLKAPITCLFLTRDDGHLLVGLRDGKLIVITGDRT